MQTPTVKHPNPPFWVRLSIVAGNVIQIVGLVIGALLLRAAAHSDAADILRVILMIAGWLIIYICCHAFGHWVVGRLVRIRFQGYGVRGTDHPENYPPGLRQLMSVVPFFTVMSEKSSMARATPLSKALMFAAGETSTTVCSLAAAWYAWSRGVPGGAILFVVALLWVLAATISTAMFPKGDYAKALRALRS